MKSSLLQVHNLVEENTVPLGNHKEINLESLVFSLINFINCKKATYT